MANEITIPALPCASINETLEFYVALGFEITYQQTRPNTYACVKRDDIDLHFFSMKGYDPAQSYSTCLVLVQDVDEIYQTFRAGLRQHYGKLPVTGIPRIGRPNNNNVDGDRRFNVVDPGGNWIRFIQKVSRPEPSEPTQPQKGQEAKFSRTLRAAQLQAEHGDYEGAARMLDRLLEKHKTMPAENRLPTLVLRAEMALMMEEVEHARMLLADIQQMPLSDDERASWAEHLERADDLKQMIVD